MRRYSNNLCNTDYLAHFGIKDMKWGKRRYQNKDGTLTDAGKKRYAKDKKINARKKNKDRIDLSEPDADRWVTEDLEKARKVTDISGDMVKQFKNVERSTAPTSKKVRMDLSDKTNKELQEAINRETLELRYNDLFSKPQQIKVSKGRQIVRNTLDVAGEVVPMVGSALGIALAIRALQDK